MKKKILSALLVLTLLIGAASLTGCGGEEQSSGAQTTNKIVVGLDDTFAPMGFRDDKGDLVGFDIDLATAVAKDMGYEVEFKPIDWDAKEAELQAGTIDCVWNGMSATPERIENMALTSCYLDNKIVLMTMSDNNLDIVEADQLKDIKIGTQKDSAALEMMQADAAYETFKDNITEYDTYDTAIMDMKAGRVDVIAVDQVLGEYTNNNLDGAMRVCTYDFGNDYYAIGFYKENTELRDKVDASLKKLVEDGTAGEISKTWFGKDICIYKTIEEIQGK